jgi:hypothetical protein
MSQLNAAERVVDLNLSNGRSSRFSNTIAKAQAAAALITLAVISLACSVASASSEGRTLKLGPGAMRNLALQVASAATIDVQPGAEAAWYLIVQPDRYHYHYIQVGILASDIRFRFDGTPRQICIAGLRGLTSGRGASRTIILQAPAEATGVYSIIFGFDDRDQESWAIVNSIAINGRRGTC